MSEALRVVPILRWLLLVPATVGAWWAVLIVGLAAHMRLEAQCPPAEITSGMCMDDGINALQDALMHASVGMSALLVVLVAAVVAPFHRRAVAVAVYAAGLGMAGWMARSGQDGMTLFASAVAGGLIGLGLVFWGTRQRRGAPRAGS